MGTWHPLKTHQQGQRSGLEGRRDRAGWGWHCGDSSTGTQSVVSVPKLSLCGTDPSGTGTPKAPPHAQAGHGGTVDTPELGMPWPPGAGTGHLQQLHDAFPNPCHTIIVPTFLSHLCCPYRHSMTAVTSFPGSAGLGNLRGPCSHSASPLHYSRPHQGPSPGRPARARGTHPTGAAPPSWPSRCPRPWALAVTRCWGHPGSQFFGQRGRKRGHILSRCVGGTWWGQGGHKLGTGSGQGGHLLGSRWVEQGGTWCSQ